MYFEFRTKEEFNKIIKTLKKKGYECTGTGELTYEEIKNYYTRNRVYIIEAFYNSINKKLEYMASTRQIVKSYPPYKIKISNINDFN